MYEHEEYIVVCDANVLIDYALTDDDIIRELSSYWKRVIVPDVVFNEVIHLSKTRAMELGLVIEETPLSILIKQPGLSMQDVSCLYHLRKMNKC